MLYRNPPLRSVCSFFAIVIISAFAYASPWSANLDIFASGETGKIGADAVLGSPSFVSATAGTPTGSYPTLKDAFDAIDLGTHQGRSTISVARNTVQPASAVLHS